MGATSTFWLASPLSGNWVMLSWIVEAFAGLQEYRVGKVAKGRPRHPLLGLLMILFLSRVAGCRGWDASADWARAHFEVLRRHLPLWIRPPSADTLRRTAEAYDLDDVLAGIEADGEAVHIDGKRARGATGDGRVHHFIEALCGTAVVGMIETGAGAEGPAIAALLEDLGLSGKIVTVDAAGTTPAVAAAITGSGADFLPPAQDNQPGRRRLRGAAPTSCSRSRTTSRVCGAPWKPPSRSMPDGFGRPGTGAATRCAAPGRSPRARRSTRWPPPAPSPASGPWAGSSAPGSPRTASPPPSTTTSAPGS